MATTLDEADWRLRRRKAWGAVKKGIKDGGCVEDGGWWMADGGRQMVEGLVTSNCRCRRGCRRGRDGGLPAIYGAGSTEGGGEGGMKKHGGCGQGSEGSSAVFQSVAGR